MGGVSQAESLKAGPSMEGSYVEAKGALEGTQLKRPLFEILVNLSVNKGFNSASVWMHRIF